MEIINPILGGLSEAKLLEATATERDVIYPKTFYAGNGIKKVGNLHVEQHYELLFSSDGTFVSKNISVGNLLILLAVVRGRSTSSSYTQIYSLFINKSEVGSSTNPSFNIIYDTSKNIITVHNYGIKFCYVTIVLSDLN